MKRSPFTAAAASLLAILGLAALTGCPKVPRQTPLMKQVPDVQGSAAELRLIVHAFAEEFSGVVEDAADRIIANSSDPEIRRNALMWKIHAIPEAQRAVFHYDPIAGAVDVWSFCLQLRDYFEDGPGRELFGEQQWIAVEATKRLERDVEDLVRAMKGGQELSSESVDLVHDWVEQNPLEGPLYNRVAPRRALARWAGLDAKRGAFAVMGSLDEGVSDLADRLSIYANSMPNQARWQAELLVEEITSREEVDRGLRSITELAAALDRIGKIVDDLPDLVSDERETAVEQLHGEILFTDELIGKHRDVILEEALRTVAAERIAILEAIAAEILALLEALQDERALVTSDLDDLTSRVVDDTLDRAETMIDRTLWKAALLIGASLAVFQFAGVFLLRMLGFGRGS